MKRKKRTETTIETHQLFVIRKPEGSVLTWCPGCNAETRMIASEAAAILGSVNALTVFRWVEAGLVHFTETPDGALLVCPNSLPSSPSAAAIENLIKEGEDHD